MKKTIMSFVLLFLYCAMQAQQVGNIRLESVRFDHLENQVHVEIDLPLKDYYVHYDNSLSFIPFIKSDTIERTLPRVIMGTINIEKEKLTDVYAIHPVNSRSNLHYSVDIPYESWMDNARLIIKKEVGKPGSTGLYTYTGVLKNSLERKRNNLPDNPAQPAFAFLLPTATSSATESSTGYLHTRIIDLHYPDMRSSNVLDIPANQTRIEEICEVISQIVNNQDYSLIGVYITGYTSPEGIYYDNEQLAKKRAQAFQSYIRNRCSLPASYFTASWIGEDWLGLVTLINENMNVPSKDQVLRIIDNVGIFKGREKQLMILNGGVPYRYMKTYLFSQLQRVECKIIYRVK